MRRFLAVVVALAAVAAACGGSGGPSTVRIGALYPRSGSQGVGGAEEERGVELAVQWANDHGGVRGRRAQLEGVDAARAEAVPAALTALRRRGVTVVLGSHGSSISAVAAELAGRAGISFWETGAVGEIPTETAGDGAVQQIRGANQELVGTFAYDARTADFAPLAARIGAAHPDVLFVAAYLDDGVALRRALVAGHVPLLTAIGTSSSFCMPAFGARLGPDAVGLFASDKPDAADVRAAALLPEGRRALRWAQTRYESRWHEPMSAPALSGFAGAYALL